MKYIKQLALATIISSTIFTACNKDDDPVIDNTPEEQELITTVRLNVTNTSGFNKTFNYKVDNGFGSTTPATPVIDDVVLNANESYNVTIEVLNESENPAENITTEVLEESNEHLFVLESNPATGAGSITFANGNKDNNGEPLNQTIQFITTDAGSGVLTVTLKHQPTNKSAANSAAAGGETDAQAVFPVTIN